MFVDKRLFLSLELAKAYYEIIKERGENASWYAIESPILDEWEKNYEELLIYLGCSIRIK